MAQINGIPVYSMGVNNYSYGMELLVFSPKDITIEEVKLLPNVFLNPTAQPNSLEIFALGGTQEQYDKLLAGQKETWVCQQAYRRLGHTRFIMEETPEWEQFKPWWE